MKTTPTENSNSSTKSSNENQNTLQQFDEHLIQERLSLLKQEQELQTYNRESEELYQKQFQLVLTINSLSKQLLTVPAPILVKLRRGEALAYKSETVKQLYQSYFKAIGELNNLFKPSVVSTEQLECVHNLMTKTASVIELPDPDKEIKVKTRYCPACRTLAAERGERCPLCGRASIYPEYTTTLARIKAFESTYPETTRLNKALHSVDDPCRPSKHRYYINDINYYTSISTGGTHYPQRSIGVTTRLVNELIELLFEYNQVYVRDYCSKSDVDATMHIMFKRLRTEHPHVAFDIDSHKFKVSIAAPQFVPLSDVK